MALYRVLENVCGSGIFAKKRLTKSGGWFHNRVISRHMFGIIRRYMARMVPIMREINGSSDCARVGIEEGRVVLTSSGKYKGPVKIISVND